MPWLRMNWGKWVQWARTRWTYVTVDQLHVYPGIISTINIIDMVAARILDSIIATIIVDK